MNSSLISLEVSVIAIGLVLMLADFFVPAERRRFICYAGIVALGALLLINLSGNGVCDIQGTAFNGSYINDGLAIFFKRFFIIAAILVLFIAAEFADKFAAGAVAEYYSLIVFALAGILKLTPLLPVACLLLYELRVAWTARQEQGAWRRPASLAAGLSAGLLLFALVIPAAM